MFNLFDVIKNTNILIFNRTKFNFFILILVEFRCDSMYLLVSKWKLGRRLNFNGSNTGSSRSFFVCPICGGIFISGSNDRRNGQCCCGRKSAIISKFNCYLFLTVTHIILIETIIEVITRILSCVVVKKLHLMIVY